MHDLSLEFYIGVIGVFFAALGAWIGWRITRGKNTQRSHPTDTFRANEDKLRETGISRRELDVLELMYMFNNRVENLTELLKLLREEGVTVVGEIEEFPYGKFGWIMDPEGNKIELWEPVDEGF